jgi:glycosyltransferase involved in cell wall biosynthesis
MPKVAIISNSAFSVVNFRSNFIKDLVSQGCTVYALAPDFTQKERTPLRNIEAVPVDYYMERTGQNPLKDVRSLGSLVKTLKKISPDITFSYGIKPVVYGLWAARIININRRYAMVAGLGTLYADPEGASLKKRASRRVADYLYKFSLPFADKVFFQNPDDIELFEEQGIIQKGQPVLINGSGVDVNHYRADGLPQQDITFTLVSRLIKEKGIYEFVESARRLRSKYPDKNIKFTLLGDVDANPNLVKTSELQGWVAEGIIRWPGHVDEVKPWLEKTSVFVLPTYYREGTPKSMLEAMAMSRPVISTDMPGCREAVEEGRNGYLIEPKSVEQLVSAMERFISEPDLIGQMGAESRKIAVAKYDVKDVNARLMENMGLV